MKRWLIRRTESHEALGPFTALEVTQKIKKGEFSLDDFVCEEGFATWTPIRKRKEILNVLDMDITEFHRKSREEVDASKVDEILIEEKEPEVPPGVVTQIETGYQRKLLWGLLVVVVVLVGGLLLLERYQRAEKKEKVEEPIESPAIIQTKPARKVPRKSEKVVPSDVLKGISRFSQFEPGTFEQKEGTLLDQSEDEIDEEPRRRVRPKPTSRGSRQKRANERRDRDRKQDVEPYDEGFEDEQDRLFREEEAEFYEEDRPIDERERVRGDDYPVEEGDIVEDVYEDEMEPEPPEGEEARDRPSEEGGLTDEL